MRSQSQEPENSLLEEKQTQPLVDREIGVFREKPGFDQNIKVKEILRV